MKYTPMPPIAPGQPGDKPITMIFTTWDFSRIVACAWAWVPADGAGDVWFMHQLVTRTLCQVRAARPVPVDTRAASMEGHEHPSEEMLASMKEEYEKGSAPIFKQVILEPRRGPARPSNN